MNYLQSDIFQLIKDTKKAAFLLNSKTFDKTNWLTLHCPKGPQGVFASVEWLHFSNLERHLNNVISPSTQIFEKISDIQCNTPLSSDIQMQIKKSAELTLFELSCAKSRIFQVSQTAHDMEVHNKTFSLIRFCVCSDDPYPVLCKFRCTLSNFVYVQMTLIRFCVS